MKSLEVKVEKSRQIVLKAAKEFCHEKIVVAWTGGKDSTVLLHLIRSVFKNKVPFPVMFNDSTMEFDEIYQFIKHLTKRWCLNLLIETHDKKMLKEFHIEKNDQIKRKMSRLMKVAAIDSFINKYQPRAFFVGIRWDEHSARSKEKYFSPRKNHTRLHPILHFSENDIWNYIKIFKVPYVPLYDQGYRSLGEAPFTKKARPNSGERSGREYNKERLMEKLRNMGYW